jgi:hypothetical protein
MEITAHFCVRYLKQNHANINLALQLLPSTPASRHQAPVLQILGFRIAHFVNLAHVLQLLQNC